MICFTIYSEHDVNYDPILVLPCKHFFAISTLDRHVDISEVYVMDQTGNFVATKELLGSNVSEKPKLCPECRSPIHSVRRYNRFLRLSDLRSLERKHMGMVDQHLKLIAAKLDEGKTKGVKKNLNNLEKKIRKSPMRVVFEACGGVELVETAPPPASQLIRCLELQSIACEKNIKESNDENFLNALKAYEKAMTVADESKSSRSGARIRLATAKLQLKFCQDPMSIRSKVIPLLDWIISSPVKFDDLIRDAEQLKQELSEEMLAQKRVETIRAVVAAMGKGGGYDYGGSASSHWYECPNGHPYFIGECGGAMQEATCIECGERVGGGGHALLGTNRSSTLVRDAISRN